MERLSETQYWFVVAAGLLTPMLTFWIIDIIGWVLRRTLWRRSEMPPPSATKPACDEPASVAAPPV
jgi:hypothetical protein